MQASGVLRDCQPGCRAAVQKLQNSHGEPEPFRSATYLVRNSGAKRSATQMGIIGYARVSTDGQSVDAQVTELTAAGANRLYQE